MTDETGRLLAEVLREFLDKSPPQPVTLQYDLSSPEQETQFKAAIAAMGMARFIEEFQQHMRRVWKYEDLTDRDPNEVVDALREAWYNMKEEYVPNFEDFYY